jgi:hypothetical protein
MEKKTSSQLKAINNVIHSMYINSSNAQLSDFTDNILSCAGEEKRQGRCCDWRENFGLELINFGPDLNAFNLRLLASINDGSKRAQSSEVFNTLTFSATKMRTFFIKNSDKKFSRRKLLKYCQQITVY